MNRWKDFHILELARLHEAIATDECGWPLDPMPDEEPEFTLASEIAAELHSRGVTATSGHWLIHEEAP